MMPIQASDQPPEEHASMTLQMHEIFIGHQEMQSETRQIVLDRGPESGLQDMIKETHEASAKLAQRFDLQPQQTDSAPRTIMHSTVQDAVEKASAEDPREGWSMGISMEQARGTSALVVCEHCNDRGLCNAPASPIPCNAEGAEAGAAVDVTPVAQIAPPRQHEDQEALGAPVEQGAARADPIRTRAVLRCSLACVLPFPIICIVFSEAFSWSDAGRKQESGKPLSCHDEYPRMMLASGCLQIGFLFSELVYGLLLADSADPENLRSAMKAMKYCFALALLAINFMMWYYMFESDKECGPELWNFGAATLALALIPTCYTTARLSISFSFYLFSRIFELA
jgi:hypothetical protein